VVLPWEGVGVEQLEVLHLFFSWSDDARDTFGLASGFSRHLEVPSTPSSIILKGSLSKQSRVKWVEHNL
jgi:hypothetical protein